MTGYRFLAALMLLAACQPVGVEAPGRADLGIGLLRNQSGPPEGPEGACWSGTVTPAVIETVTEQTLVTPELRDAEGRITQAAGFRSSARQRIVQDREEVWFRAPCDAEMTPEFVASLQRALKARGLYLLPLSGEMDAATMQAVRRFQADRGLDSPVLSLGAARELGLIAADRDSL